MCGGGFVCKSVSINLFKEGTGTGLLPLIVPAGLGIQQVKICVQTWEYLGRAASGRRVLGSGCVPGLFGVPSSF